MTQVK